MSRQICYFCLLLELLLCLPLPVQALDYPPDFKFLKVPDPLSGDNPRYSLLPRTAPLPGESFFDLRFGTVLSRTVQGNPVRHEYARFDPFNADLSMVILHSGDSNWQIYKTSPMPYDQPENLAATGLGLQELRWDPQVPTLLWALDGENFSIVTYQPHTGVRTIIKDFRTDPVLGPIITTDPELWRLTTREEGEASSDMRYWGLMLQGGDAYDFRNVYIICYDRAVDTVLGTYKFSAAQGSAVDWAGMSPKGTWVIMGGDVINAQEGGITLANKKLENFYLIATNIGHNDISLDARGREVLVGQNAATDNVDMIPLDPGTKPVPSPHDYPGSGATRLLHLYYDNTSPLGFNSGIHVSCNYPGYAVISPYIFSGMPEQNWLDRTLVLIRLDPGHPRAYYLAKVYNTTGEFLDGRNYWEETHASITRDGSRIVWSDNWGTPGPDMDHNQGFLIQLEMPPNWQGRLSGTTTPLYFLLLLGD